MQMLSSTVGPLRGSYVVLARCYFNNRVFHCDVSLIASKLVICNLVNNVLIEIKVSDVKSVDYRDSELILTLTNNEKLVVSALTPSSSIINDIGRVLELRIKLPTVSNTLRKLTPVTLKLIKLILNVLITLSANYQAGWVQLKYLPNELTLMNIELSDYGIDLSERIKELSKSITMKDVNAIKDLFKRLILEAVNNYKKTLKSLLIFEDLSLLADIIVLAFTTNLAYTLNQQVDAEKALIELNNLCYIDIYVKIFNRTSTNLCDVLVKSIKEVDIERAINEFINMFINSLNDMIETSSY